ncbi:hypothetical protein GCM10007216_27500 [Thalassobacillus devorans]|uniref:Uncharacterized protein n=1 Tax=Thalassobacillus devorans TaxID=279813 RepID=A0ABQ1PDV6_9BACI|nr:hypothetical protein [Thalassobacillus devorans]NIK29252.1 hypothetical protein [Thalassobacillus devorans]GGC95247.1 hypothetical protein GCM10007216_27500 [Thalassobacillus devorans]
MVQFNPFRGTVTMIQEFITGVNEEEGCYKIISVENETGALVNFIVAPTTYFVDQAIVNVGDMVTGYYDRNAPVPFIYPPQYRALVMVKESSYQKVKVDYFDSQLVSSDDFLRLNLAPNTPILLANGQPFSGNPANRNLIVIYGPATKSIPAQTTPYRVIVWC